MAEPRKSNVPSMWSSAGMFEDFRKEMDGLINGFFGSGRQFPEREKLWANLPAGVMSPAIDVSENDETIKLTAELPGLAEEDVDLTVRDGVLTIRGEKKHELDEEKDNVHVTERAYGSFQRSMPVPDRVKVDDINARFDKGVLIVTMPKKAEAVTSPRKIAIDK
ncbi:Hsp20/alpha crystallin family protein [Oricola cellulosilytica]|uniref:Hsp20/alpha crystallin family protein n=1 Tax=Oricola cellulosilytica TaxID=1429082 RepID=A0A4R0PAX2_9HYPH|nr:Hsp20/alpha crystallin family protein [Oricola cellulosilytica]TCD13118.1 Hsp20/alpha crystallin family protein [Oricola cellulosilytica]